MLFTALLDGTSGVQGSLAPSDMATSSSRSESASVSPTSHFVANARVEAFALHLRNIITFFYPDVYQPWHDDVVAHHFVAADDPYSTWLNTRGPISPALDKAKIRADKELAHLTTHRRPGSGVEKRWKMVPLAKEVFDVLELFVNAADDSRLAGSVKDEVCRFRRVLSP